MFNVGGPEVLIILVVALVVLGPSKLPEASRSVGKAMAEFRRMSTGFQTELRDALNEPIDTTASSQPTPPPSPPPADPLTTADDEPTA